MASDREQTLSQALSACCEANSRLAQRLTQQRIIIERLKAIIVGLNAS